MTTPVLSAQLYTFREAVDADLDDALARIAALGITDVEVFDFVRRAPELSEALKGAGLTATSGHAPLLSEELTFGGNTIPTPSNDEIFSAARELGLTYVIDPMVTPDRWASKSEVEATAARLNEAAKVARTHGLTVGYHNHSQEFHHEIEGTSAFEYFVSLLDDDVVIELDAYWAAVGGQDVPALVDRLGSRLVALHVKDGATGFDPFRTGEFDLARLGQVGAGAGAVPLAEALDAAPALRLAIIEYDHAPGDVFDAAAETVGFLAERGIR